MIRLTREAQDIVVSGRIGGGLTASDRERIRGKLAQRLGAGLAAGAFVHAGSAAAEAARSTWAASLFTWGSVTGKVVSVAVIVMAAGAGFVGAPRLGLLHRDDPPSSPSRAAARVSAPRIAVNALEASPKTAELLAPEPAELLAPESAAPVEAVRLTSLEGATPAVERNGGAPASSPSLAGLQPPRPQTMAAVEEPAANDSPAPLGTDLNHQIVALRQARAAIREGDGKAALGAIDQGLPQGQSSPLEEESTYSRILALCQLGRTTEARQQAERFLTRFPQSPLSARVRNTCGFGVARFSD